MSKTLIGMGSAAMDSIICCSSLPGDDSFQVVDSEQLLPGGSCARAAATTSGNRSDRSRPCRDHTRLARTSRTTTSRNPSGSSVR